jgi:PPOX class probable F420-dependent enzyme
MRIPDSVRDILATGPLVHVTTRHPDDRLHVTLAWAGVEGDQVLFSTFSSPHKVADIDRDPRVTLSFHVKEWTGEGLWPYVVIDGTATVSEGGALELMDRLASAYIGPGAVFGWRDAPPGWVFRLTPQRIYGVGPWREDSGS